MPNQELLKFLSLQGEKKNFSNLETILNLEEIYPGIFAKIMTNFEDVKGYRESLDENGKPIIVSWKEALKKYYINKKYEGVTKENEYIAELFGNKGLSQELFDSANELRKIAKKDSVKEHILNKLLKEETILESIERIKNQTKEELISGREIIEELYDKQFTYEWLNKNDPHNDILGLFCSCCGSITSKTYGKDIAMLSIIAPDVQNLVIRNSKGDIIAKGTMYVNKDKDYAVINDFELNKIYRNNEVSSGIYETDKTGSEELEREVIFKAFQRGLKVFIEEYDRQNPDKPLQQINVGMGFNRLKRQVKRFKKATSNLAIPPKYRFNDAKQDTQYILYQRNEKQRESGGEER